MSAEDFSRAAETLTSHLSSHEDKLAANSWLSDFQTRTEAWALYESVLDEGLRVVATESRHCLAAISFRRKLALDFTDYTGNGEQLLRKLVSMVKIYRTKQGGVLVADRLILAIADISVVANWLGCVDQLQADFADAPEVLLKCLEILPEEAYNDEVLLERHARDAFIKALRSQTPKIISLLESLRNQNLNDQIIACLSSWMVYAAAPWATKVLESPLMNDMMTKLVSDPTDTLLSALTEILKSLMDDPKELTLPYMAQICNLAGTEVVKASRKALQEQNFEDLEHLVRFLSLTAKLDLQLKPHDIVTSTQLREIVVFLLSLCNTPEGPSDKETLLEEMLPLWDTMAVLYCDIDSERRYGMVSQENIEIADTLILILKDLYGNLMSGLRVTDDVLRGELDKEDLRNYSWYRYAVKNFLSILPSSSPSSLIAEELFRKHPLEGKDDKAREAIYFVGANILAAPMDPEAHTPFHQLLESSILPHIMNDISRPTAPEKYVLDLLLKTSAIQLFTMIASSKWMTHWTSQIPVCVTQVVQQMQAQSKTMMEPRSDTHGWALGDFDSAAAGGVGEVCKSNASVLANDTSIARSILESCDVLVENTYQTLLEGPVFFLIENGDPQYFAKTLEMLLAPSVHGIVHAQSADIIFNRLDRISIILKTLHTIKLGPEKAQIVCTFSRDHLYPVVSTLIKNNPDNPIIVEKSMRAVRHSLRCIDKLFTPFVEPLIELILESAKLHLHSTYLYATEWLTADFSTDSTTAPLIQKLFGSLTELTLDRFFRSEADTLDLMEDAFGMFQKVARYSPSTLVHSPWFPRILQASLRCMPLNIATQEASVLYGFITRVIMLTYGETEVMLPPEALKSVVVPLVEKVVPDLVCGSLRCIVDGSPPFILAHIETLLKNLLARCPERYGAALRDGFKILPKQLVHDEQTADRLWADLVNPNEIQDKLCDIAGRCRQLRNRKVQ